MAAAQAAIEEANPAVEGMALSTPSESSFTESEQTVQDGAGSPKEPSPATPSDELNSSSQTPTAKLTRSDSPTSQINENNQTASLAAPSTAAFSSNSSMAPPLVPPVTGPSYTYVIE
jgi:hypothetical protein